MQAHVYLVSTHAGLFKVTFDTDFDLVSCTKLRAGHHYALSVRPVEQLIYSKNRDEFLNIFTFDELEKIGEFVFDTNPGQVHQAVMTDQGVILTDTLNNRLTFQPHGGSSPIHHYQIDGHTTDVNHVNSVFLRGGGLVAMLHNRRAKPSEVLDLDFNPQAGFKLVRRRFLADVQCHNVFLEGQNCIFNASEAGDLVVRNMRTDTDIYRMAFNGHTKGLSVTSEHLVIGVSDVAQQAKRSQTASRLAVFDRKRLRLVSLQPLHETTTGNVIGNVNEVRCLSSQDFSEGSASERPLPRPKQVLSWWNAVRTAARPRSAART